jgi:hypothetical protein
LWWGRLPLWAQERISVYLYRGWPVLNTVEKDPVTGEKVDPEEFGYIDKLPGDQPIRSATELRDKYGSGDYLLILNDVVSTYTDKSKKTIMLIDIRESFRDIKNYPPTDDRIDNVSNVNLDEPANKSYVAYLRNAGKLPEQNKGREAMAEVTAVQQMTGMMDKMLTKVMDNKKEEGGEGASAKAMEVVAHAAMKGQEIMAESITRAETQRTTAPNPLETIKGVMDLVKEMTPKAEKDSDLTAIVQSMVESNKDLNKRIMDIQEERIKSAERIAQAAAEKVNNPGSTGIDGLLNDVDKVEKLRNLFGGGKPDVDETIKAGGKIFGMNPDVLQGIIQGVGGIFATGMGAWQTYMQAQMYMAAVRAGQPMPVPPIPEQPQAQAPAPGTALVPANMTPEQQLAQVHQFLAVIERPLLAHFEDGSGGHHFARWLIEGYRQATYDEMRSSGAEQMKMVLRSYKPIADAVQGKDRQLDKFIQEFMNAEEMLAKEEEGEGEEVVAITQ